MSDTIMSARSQIKRFPGVDFAKIVAMYLVLVLHVTACGINIKLDNNVYSCVWTFLLSVSEACVDLFALATGFLCVRSSCRYSRVFNLWLSAVFWGVTMLTICRFVGCSVPWESYGVAVLPLFQHEYWFLNAYVMMFFFMPLMNKGINAMSRKDFHRLFVAIAIFIGGYSVWGDQFHLLYGLSFPWLCIVYIVGSYIRVYNPCRWKASTCFMAAGSVALITCLRQFLSLLMGYRIPGDRFCLFSHLSIFTLSIAVLLFLGCLKLSFDVRASRFLKMGASATFGVYLIHTQPFVWENVWRKNFHQITIESSLQLMGIVLGFSAVCLFFLLILEHCRLKVFEKLRVNRIGEKIDELHAYPGFLNSP